MGQDVLRTVDSKLVAGAAVRQYVSPRDPGAHRERLAQPVCQTTAPYYRGTVTNTRTFNRSSDDTRKRAADQLRELVIVTARGAQTTKGPIFEIP